MIAEYAILPDVFDPSCYEHAAVCELCLRLLKEELLNGGVVRDLRDGAWSRYIKRNRERWEPKLSLELLRKLENSGRLRNGAKQLDISGEDAISWGKEALASNADKSMDFIVASEATASQFTSKLRGAIIAINRLKRRPCSKVVKRDEEGYREKLEPIFSWANSVKLIDPYLDLALDRYGALRKLLVEFSIANPQCVVEVFCAARTFNGGLNESTLRARLAGMDKCKFKKGVTIFACREFHDRHLLSNLGGFFLGNGFDTKEGDSTTWARMENEDRWNLDKKFSENSFDIKLSYRLRQ